MTIGKVMLRRPGPAEVRLPLAWLEPVARLPGKGLHVALALVWLATLRGDAQVRMSRSALVRFGVSRDACYDAFKRLEEVGLIRVERQAGCAPRVMLLGPGGLRLKMA